MKRFYDLLAILAAVCTPIAPATFYGWQAYSATLTITGIGWLSILAGIALALALELVGYLAGHAAIAYFERGDRRWLIAAAILIAYVAFGAWELAGVQRTAFFIAPLVYLLLALYRALHEEEAAEAAAVQDEREWQRQQAAEAAQRQHELELERIRGQQVLAVERARAKVELAQAELERERLAEQRAVAAAEPAPASYICEDCYQPFGSQPALNAHRRHCKGIPISANGHAR